LIETLPHERFRMNAKQAPRQLDTLTSWTTRTAAGSSSRALPIPGALERLRVLLDGSRHPRLVIVYRRPQAVDPTGRLGRILRDDYRVAERVPSTGITILRSSSA
jgi:hypothetical protein